VSTVSDADLRKSKRSVVAQNILLVIFAIVALFAPKNLLFASNAGRMIGNVIATIGVLLILFAVISLRRVIQVAPEPKEGGQLIQSGAYKYLRHPIYSGIIFCVIGLFLRAPTIWIAIASLVVIVFLLFKARFEEKLLLIAYPDYEKYRKRTWGLFPGLR
jgi:protein-S-isoprenylcysteine O-methyltransferase Ste14